MDGSEILVITLIIILSFFLIFYFNQEFYEKNESVIEWKKEKYIMERNEAWRDDSIKAVGSAMTRFAWGWRYDDIPEEIKQSEPWKKMEALVKSREYLMGKAYDFSLEEWQDMADKARMYISTIEDMRDAADQKRIDDENAAIETNFNYAFDKNGDNQ